jgi:outer membrane protein assembly factor BamB
MIKRFSSFAFKFNLRHCTPALKANGVVYIGADTALYALNAASGRGWLSSTLELKLSNCH